jgi:hypothetical protein
MPALEKIAYFQNRRDEVPNQQLAKELAESKNREGIREIAEHLWDKNKNIRSDCLKVLYEIGYIDPDLIVDYTDYFLKLIKDKNNRLVWGAMIALALVAEKKQSRIWSCIDDIIEAVDNGSVITVVCGIRVLAKVAASNSQYCERLFPYLLGQIRKAIPRDVPLHAESILCAVHRRNKEEFFSVLDNRKNELKTSQLTKLRKVVKLAEKLSE